MAEMRLQKFLAESGVASRRKSEEMIQMGLVKVNGVCVTTMGLKVNDSDIVEVSGKRVGIAQKKLYIMLNKPQGYVTTVKDQFKRSSVIDLVKDIKERIYPVGRLDYDTSGLLLLTNDGDFTYKVTHPKHEMEKVYIANVMGIPDVEDVKSFKRGVRVDDYITAPAVLKILEAKEEQAVLEIVVHEGKNREVRKMCEAIQHPVTRLKRVAVGKLKLGDLPEGKWRFLTDKELKRLVESEN